MRWRLVVMLALAGCPGDDPPPACIEVDLSCAPLYVPTFDNVYSNTLVDGCGSQRVSCHSAAGMKGGMSFEDPDTAHAALLAGRVTPGNAGCSEMVVRTSSVGADYQMPPGSALSVAERCALIQWVQNGALGPGEVAP
jgi:Planctomycete cytochrome C